MKHGIPYIYGACVGVEGRIAAFNTHPTAPCLRCLFSEPPAAGELPTCDTAGVLGPVASVIGSMQAITAIKLLTGNVQLAGDQLLTMDLWSGRIRAVSLAGAKRKDCPTCALRRFDFLNRPTDATVTLCGRNAMQILPPGISAKSDLAKLAAGLCSAGEVQTTPYFLKCTMPDGVVLTVFPDARMVAYGTTDANRVRSLFARYIGT